MRASAGVALAVVLGLAIGAGCGSRPAEDDAGVDLGARDGGDVEDGADLVCAPPEVPGCTPGGFGYDTEADALACFEACSSDADCEDPCQPYCSIQGLVMYGDYNCNGQIRVCRSLRQDDCTPF